MNDHRFRAINMGGKDKIINLSINVQRSLMFSSECGKVGTYVSHKVFEYIEINDMQ